MNLVKITTLTAAVLLLWGCGASPRQAERSMQASWVGKPSDAFFSRYGAPQSSFKLNDGGTLFRWRGGETTVNLPAQYRTVTTPGLPGLPIGDIGHTHSNTTVSQINPNTTVTRTTSRSFSFGLSLPLAQQVLVAPARTEQLFCEAEITVDAKGLISHVHALQDTHGANFSLSRCAEVFEVK